MASLLFDPALLKKASGMLNVLDQDVLVTILKALHAKGSMTVTEIYIHLRSDQSTVSMHLRKLREANFVVTTRSGKYIYYSVNQHRLEKLQKVLDSFINRTHNMYLDSYSQYVRYALNQFAPEPALETFEGLLSWANSFTHMLRLYNQALEEKATKLMQEVKKNKRFNYSQFQAELEEIKKTAIRDYWRKHRY